MNGESTLQNDVKFSRGGSHNDVLTEKMGQEMSLICGRAVQGVNSVSFFISGSFSGAFWGTFFGPFLMTLNLRRIRR